MADDHRPLAQRGGQRSALMRRMTREDEVSGGRQHFEVKPDQSAVEPLSAFDHASSAPVKICFLLQGGDGAGLGGPAKRIGVEAGRPRWLGFVSAASTRLQTTR
jgi:hypothetical protein